MSDPDDPRLRATEYRPPTHEDEAVSPPHRVSQYVAGEVVAERYRLIRKLGEGGMGVVWVAHSLVLGVDVAIKLIRTGIGDVDMASRMAREAQATAILGHPAIVRVFDHGATALGEPFLVMELVEGETLSALLTREGKLDPIFAVKLLLPLLDGLRCAHESGIIHRDIKPENVLIGRDALGRQMPKLLDFGIAKLDYQPSVNRLTQVGDVLGSPEFMSPEQARGAADIDARTDVWGVSVVLYELVTGQLPFKIKNYNALMQAILHEQPKPTFELGIGDKHLWRVISKGLAKTRERRWPSMTALGEALAFWLYDHGETEDACGNSLRAVWLAGTLSGQSMRPRQDSWAEVSSPAAATTEPTDRARAMPTLNIRFRRLRHQLSLLMTPPIMTGVGVLFAIMLVIALFGLASGEEEEQVRPAAPAVTEPSAPPVAPSAPPVPARSESPDVTKFENLPLASDSAEAKKRPRYVPPPQPAQRPQSTQKRYKDYGL
jgi:eukaryotic-like serine/threonine-protein kinase